jgi:hypothetical protein
MVVLASLDSFIFEGFRLRLIAPAMGAACPSPLTINRNRDPRGPERKPYCLPRWPGSLIDFGARSSPPLSVPYA